MAGSRIVRRKRVRKRRIKLLSSILLVLFLGTVGYTALQVAQGQDIADEGGGFDEEDKEEADEFTKEKEKADPEKKKEYNDNKVNVLLVGSDQREENKVDRTDTIMIGQFDKETGDTKLVSIMRDTYVDIPEGYGYNKINASYAYGGVNLLTKTIEQNFGITIDHFAEVNFEGFTHIVDEIAPKGIKMDVEKRMKYQDGAGTIDIDLHPGVQRLSGSQLLDYARFRADAKSDFGRVERQQKVISLLKSEVLSISNFFEVGKIGGMVSGYVNTDLGVGGLMNYGQLFARKHDGNIDTKRIPVEGSYWNERYEHAGAVLAHDEETNRNALQEFLGAKPEKVANKDEEEKEDAS